MISPYEFIDVNADGEKERKLTSITELYNKLSAQETNNIRTKLNEIIGVANSIGAPLYPFFALKFKSNGNLDSLVLEVGDIVHGFYSSGVIWDNAVYLGGDPLDKANYQRIVETYEPMLFVSSGTSNDFIIPVGAIASNLFIDRGLRYKVAEWDQSANIVEIVGTMLTAGRKIYITF
jgi:hypothetical protein